MNKEETDMKHIDIPADIANVYIAKFSHPNLCTYQTFICDQILKIFT